jgi:hypothetical protein
LVWQQRAILSTHLTSSGIESQNQIVLPSMSAIPILLSAGEASGDMYAARLATALKERADVALFGMGGPRMRAAGVETIVDYSEVSVVGITEVLNGGVLPWQY